MLRKNTLRDHLSVSLKNDLLDWVF